MCVWGGGGCCICVTVHVWVCVGGLLYVCYRACVCVGGGGGLLYVFYRACACVWGAAAFRLIPEYVCHHEGGGFFVLLLPPLAAL